MAISMTDLRFKIRVLDGGLGLGLTMEYVPRMGAPEAHAQALVDELKRRNVVYGLDLEAINRVMSEHILHEEVVVAHGTPARPGKDAQVELLLLPPSFLSKSGDFDRIDFKNIDNVSEVKAGQVISRGTPCEPGEPGMNIFGKEIRAPGVHERIRHPAGKNTVISEDGLEMSAAIDGYLRWNGDVIDVCELFLVHGDVALSTGNIRYQGDVEVYGDVKPGFEVVAGKSVAVYGSVEGSVVSETGSVLVAKSVSGSETTPAVVTAQGDIQIGRARFARIESTGGNITASFAVEHSEIRAAGNLSLLAGAAINCVVEVGGTVDVVEVSGHTTVDGAGADEPITQSSDRNRRSYVRVVIPPPHPIQLAREGGQTFEGNLQDLSAGGVKVRLKGRLKEGELRNLQFKLDGVDGVMWMEAEVVRECAPLNADQPSEEREYGLRFTHIEPAVLEAIAHYCVTEDLRQHRLVAKPVLA
ncbi:MAG TPA: flagellar assembly protein A [Chloroflexota bacterium]|nr:flagellar assembly protein A [Chloroflexota bacterium]